MSDKINTKYVLEGNLWADHKYSFNTALYD